MWGDKIRDHHCRLWGAKRSSPRPERSRNRASSISRQSRFSSHRVPLSPHSGSSVNSVSPPRPRPISSKTEMPNLIRRRALSIQSSPPGCHLVSHLRPAVIIEAPSRRSRLPERGRRRVGTVSLARACLLSWFPCRTEDGLLSLRRGHGRSAPTRSVSRVGDGGRRNSPYMWVPLTTPAKTEILYRVESRVHRFYWLRDVLYW